MIQFWIGSSWSNWTGPILLCFYLHAIFPEPLAQIPFMISSSSPWGFSCFTHFIWIFMLFSISNPQQFPSLQVLHSRANLSSARLSLGSVFQWTGFFVMEKKKFVKVVQREDDDNYDLRPGDLLLSSQFCSCLQEFNVMMALKNGIEYSWIRVGGCGKLGRMSALLLLCPPYISARYSMRL